LKTFARTGDYPEAMVKILLTVINNTPAGGATLQELKEAYCDVRDKMPHNKTIYRAIRRLNILFDPLAYSRNGDQEESPDDYSSNRLAIQAVRTSPQQRYVFTLDLQVRPVDPSLAFMMALSLYPQQRGLLGARFEVVMKLVFEEIMSRLANYCSLYDEIKKYVYVSGPEPLQPQKSFSIIEKVLQAIRMKKRVKIDYFRTYDGVVTVREIEPYGLICRFNTWYLMGKCIEKNQRRIFLLSQIRRLQLVENSLCCIPADFSLHNEYCNNWGVWTEEGSSIPETIRLNVVKGLSERFRVNRYHDSQQITELPDGSAEVSFTLSGAHEMIPWLMTWGAAIEVLEPQWLRQTLADNLEKALAAYK
jgi:hypothetical protein